MFEIKGKYTTAKIMTDNVEESAVAQITELVNNEVAHGSKIVIMPDVHAGAGCTIGTTMTFTDKIVPNLVGVDIGCTVSAYAIEPWVKLDVVKLDMIIRKYVPSGMTVHELESLVDLNLDKLNTPLTDAQISRAKRSVGTLGGGNHFISIEQDEQGVNWLLVHTGSRNLGKLIAEYHQGVAVAKFEERHKRHKAEIIEGCYNNGIPEYTEKMLNNYKMSHSFNKDLAYLEGDDLKNYLHDVQIAQHFALLNHTTIARTIASKMGFELIHSVYTTHNYIDVENKLIRKGSIDATKYLFLVPLNMRDGTLLYYGNNNPDWNFSAPHGAGRVMSRGEAKRTIDLELFREQMKDIATSTVNQSTLDEAPDAYKPADEIKQALDGVYELASHLKPIYNFKASE